METCQRVTFVRIAPFLAFRNRHPQDVMWPMIMGYGAAVLEAAGFRVHVLDTWADPCTLETLQARIEDTRPDLMLVETDSPTVPLTRALAGRLKARRPFPIWACGQHASILPASLYTSANGSPQIDGCLVGEYDAVAASLAEAYRTGHPPARTVGILPFDGGPPEGEGCPVEPSQVDDLDRLPAFPDRLFALDRYRIYSSQVPVFRRLRWGFGLTTRGCPYPCIYCSPTLRQSFGSGYRQQSPERVVRDMEDQHRRLGINAIFMEDDLFTLDRERTLELCRRLEQRGAPASFVIQTRLDALDPERIRALKRAGCVGITAGVESGSGRILGILQKKTSRDTMLASAREIKRQGIPLTAYYMIGAPEETREDLEATLRLAKEIDALMIQVAYFTPYPGSSIHKRLSGERRGELKDLSHYNALAVNLSAVDTEQLEAFQKRFYRQYYFSPRYLWKYLRRRFLYAALNNGEIGLIVAALLYLFRQRSAAEVPEQEDGKGPAA